MKGELVKTQPQPIQEQAEPGQLMALIQRGASDPSVNVEKMERLVALYERLESKKAERLFNDALLLVQSKMPPIVKTARNPSTNSNYAKLENIQEIANPILFEHGFSLSFGTDQSPLPGHYGITGLLTGHGHERLYRCDVPADTHGPKGVQNKTLTHGFGSAVSYGERYLMKLILNIRLIGEDDDGNRGQQPKPPGPSSLAGNKPVAPAQEEVALKKKLVDLTRTVHGVAKGFNLSDEAKVKLEGWLLDEGAISDTEALGELSIARLSEIVKAVEAKLKG